MINQKLLLNESTKINACCIIARVGGDEFALLLPETTAQQALRAIQRIQSDLHRQHIEISYGIAQNPSEDLYAEADQQLNK